MATEQDFINSIEETVNSGKRITFAELIAKTLKGKIIEVYIGDAYEDIKLDEITTRAPAVLIGKVITAYAECLILNCAYVDQASKKVKFGNIVCLNERSVRTICEVDETGVLKDTFLCSRDGKTIKAIFGQ